MQDFMKGIDNAIEHSFHNEYDSKCSTCFSEALRIESRQREWSEMTLDELRDDRNGSPEGSPIGGWI